MKGTLESLPNLGKVSAQWLRQAGIDTPAKLEELGAVRAYFYVEALGVNPSLNLLYALQGALENSHWQHIARQQRESLLMELEALREMTDS